jgi:hypothetical protein
MRYVADMRRCQYVVQRPEGVRRRQRLNVEYVDRRAGDLLVLQMTTLAWRAMRPRVSQVRGETLRTG